MTEKDIDKVRDEWSAFFKLPKGYMFGVTIDGMSIVATKRAKKYFRWVNKRHKKMFSKYRKSLKKLDKEVLKIKEIK